MEYKEGDYVLLRHEITNQLYHGALTRNMSGSSFEWLIRAFPVGHNNRNVSPNGLTNWRTAEIVDLFIPTKLEKILYNIK